MVAAIAAFGCSRKEVTIETEGGKIKVGEKGDTFKIETGEGTVEMKDGKINIQTGEGEAVVAYGNQALPEGVSKEIPIYEPAQIQASQVLNGGKSVMLSLSTKDETSKVKQYYEEALAKGGWTMVRRMDMGPSTVLAVSKGDKQLGVTLNSDNGATLITLAFQQE
jgi:hypothetical protein